MKTTILITAVIFSCAFTILQNNPEWKAPESANIVSNPLKGNALATTEGKKTFQKLCVVCHGEQGKGDGIGGVALPRKPGNFTLAKTQSQTDGALFWKLSEGRAPMASYKGALTVTQRWQLVNYLRTFKK